MEAYYLSRVLANVQVHYHCSCLVCVHVQLDPSIHPIRVTNPTRNVAQQFISIYGSNFLDDIRPALLSPMDDPEGIIKLPTDMPAE
jgi:hypothetical protein